MVFGLEAEVGRPALDVIVEPRQFRGPPSDAGPDHADVVERGEDAEPADGRLERLDGGVVDRSLDGPFDLRHGVVVDRAEELERDVGPLWIGQAEPRRVPEPPLGGGDLAGEVGWQVDRDEQTHVTTCAPEEQNRDVTLTPHDRQRRAMTDDGDPPNRHRFSEGQGVDADYDEFTLDPPELKVDPTKVDPVDSRVLADILDRRNIDRDDVDAGDLLEVGLSYMGINRYEEATETFARAARFAEEDSLDAQEAWVNKGVAHAELEEYDEAIGAYQEALRIDDDSEHAASAETNLAYALWEFGHTEEALDHAERAVEIDPRFPQAWYNRGFFLSERGLFEDAVTAFDNAIRLGMRSAEVLEEKALALEELGEEEEAERAQERADELREKREERLVEDR